MLAAVFASVAGEPSIERAIAFESAADAAAEQTPATEIVSRSVQRGAGLFTASLVYGALLAISFLAMILAAMLALPLAARLGAWNGTLIAAAVFVVMAGIASLAMPPVDEVPAGFPANVLWNFRLASIGARAVLWGSLGLGFGGMTQIWLQGGAKPHSA
jgi:hypothetical protein